ncbi:RND family efflux transporter MFP subunit [Yoonia maritima]|uniref:RND family efflux transporter MFP subunit n=1 Tax=Yoonia maritima TaxID=1435347 RepID=A0A2T0VXT6_9RHOB|nr:efflux RND transporter periplasmic adaptor subunit [Yoonia maritima]PRY76670.1 RND family efflux transporter MFP subunit [Yoonia maritima]
MAQNSSLEDKLRSLSIDRSDTIVELATNHKSRPPRKAIPWSAITVILVLAGIAGTYFFEQKAGAVTAWVATFVQPETPQITPSDQTSTEGDVQDVSPLQAVAVAPRQREPQIVGSGHVIALHELSVGAEIEGRVQQIAVETGQQVRKGDILVRLDDSNARLSHDVARANQAVAKAQLDQAIAAAAQAAAPVVRLRPLVERGAASPAQLEDAELSQMQLEQSVEVARRQFTLAKLQTEQASAVLTLHTIRAPFDAVVVDPAVVPGQLIAQMGQGAPDDTVLLTLVDTSSLFVDVDVAERNVAQVQVDTLAEVRLDAFADRHLNAYVYAIDPRASREKGTVTVRLKLEPADHEGILVNMAAKVTFTQGREIELSALD